MKELTAKQQVIWDLCQPVENGGGGKTYKEAGAIVGVSHSVVHKTLQACQKKLGVTPKRGERLAAHGMAAWPENADPEAAAILVDAITEPGVRGKLHPIREAIKASGLPERFGKALLRRLETRYLDLKTEVKALKTNEILQMIEEKIGLAGLYLDDHALSEASARDLMMGIAMLTEKRQLLRGEPTQIISDLERKKLNELLPALLAESQRRSLNTVTADGVVVVRGSA